jgi:hypothetical protein
MVSTRGENVDAETVQLDGHSLCPATLAQVFASIHESWIEQTELLRHLITIELYPGTTPISR